MDNFVISCIFLFIFLIAITIAVFAQFLRLRIAENPLLLPKNFFYPGLLPDAWIKKVNIETIKVKILNGARTGIVM